MLAILPPPDPVHRRRGDGCKPAYDLLTACIEKTEYVVQLVSFRPAPSSQRQDYHRLVVDATIGRLSRNMQSANGIVFGIPDDVPKRKFNRFWLLQSLIAVCGVENSKDVSELPVRLPPLSGDDVVNVCHFTLIRPDLADLFARHSGLETRQFRPKSFPDSLVTRVRVTFPDLPPIMDETILLDLDEFGSLIIKKPDSWNRRYVEHFKPYCGPGRLRYAESLDNRVERLMLFGLWKPTS
jgi:hypothetical protein